MSELADRMAFENRFSRDLSKLTTQQRQELRDKLGTPPDYNRITLDDWDRWRRERRNRLLIFLLLIGTTSAEEHAEELVGGSSDVATVTDHGRKSARDWALKRATDVALRQIEDTQRALSERAEAWRQLGDVPDELIDSDLVDVMGPRRDATTATTETTNAQTAGTVGAVDGAQAAGWNTVTRWITEKDGRVCPICRPLHGKVPDLWELVLFNTPVSGTPGAVQSIILNGGPPAHPNCRCYLSVTAERAATRVRTGSMR